MADFTRIWTRDGHEWAVLGSAAEVEAKLNAMAVNEKAKWATFRVQDGRSLRIRKDFVGTILPASAT